MLDTILNVAQAHAGDIGALVGGFAVGWLERHLRVGANTVRLVAFAGDVLHGLSARGASPALQQGAMPALSDAESAALLAFAKVLVERPAVAATALNASLVAPGAPIASAPGPVPVAELPTEEKA